MLDSNNLMAYAIEILRDVVPTDFPWKVFLLGWILMSVPVTALTIGLLRRYKAA